MMLLLTQREQIGEWIRYGRVELFTDIIIFLEDNNNEYIIYRIQPNMGIDLNGLLGPRISPSPRCTIPEPRRRK